MSRLEPKVEYTQEYGEGYRCFERGGSKRECPYMKSSSAYAKWMRGYEDAESDATEGDER